MSIDNQIGQAVGQAPSPADDSTHQSQHINQPIVVWILSDWQPKFTVFSLSITLVVLSLICAVISALLFIETNRIVEMRFRYDNTCSSSSCVITKTVTEKMQSPIALYYRLTDFNQNTRTYSSAYSTSQVQSDEQTSYDPSTCGGKFAKSPVDGLIPYPCGLLPYSFFNDHFDLNVSRRDSNTHFIVDSSYLSEPITWENEIDKYSIRRLSLKETQQIKRNNRTILLPSLDDPLLQNWLKPAAHSTFRKLYKLLNISLQPGDTVTISISNNFVHPITDGQKWVVLSTTSWLGAKNVIIAWIYAAVATLLLVAALSLMITNHYKHRPSKATVPA